MNDNGDEERDEELRAIVSGTNELIRILEKSHDAHMAMQILASTTACILCSVMNSENEAQQAMATRRLAQCYYVRPDKSSRIRA